MQCQKYTERFQSLKVKEEKDRVCISGENQVNLFRKINSKITKKNQGELGIYSISYGSNHIYPGCSTIIHSQDKKKVNYMG